MTFLTFIDYYKIRYNINSESMSIFIVNSVMVFLMQIILLICVYYYLVDANSGRPWMVMMHHDVIVSRLILSILMHMTSEPEVRQAIRMLKYVINHSPAREKIQNLYKLCCGKEFPMPDDPDLLTRELLTKAFHLMKKFQNDNQIYCRHDLPKDTEFILTHCGQNF